ncbi:hypothetical protein BKA70DRAFT_1500917 [Coprinopsis sp. MPI-PUGE-AT-0042]|nr:hypothetical protein BKA70DRAFT_1500917 [Coprinopsis sp. MPI-PUGE-AT-0042]
MAIQQTPNLPFDILFHIIDEEFAAAQTPQAKTAVLANIGRACRELSIHCRPLLFHFVHLELDFNSGIKATNLKQSRAGRFAHLARHYPRSLHFVQHLSLDFHQSWLGTKDRLFNAVTRHDAVRRREWLGVMLASYPNLKALTLACSFWPTLHQEVKEAVIKMLLQTEVLDVLSLDIDRCPFDILKYCPPNVKHLTYLGQLAGGKLPIGLPTREKPRLEGFELAVDHRTLPGDGWLAYMVSVLELEGLRCMELWSANGLMGFNTFRPLVQPASATLRCLHLLGPEEPHYSFDIFSPALDLGSLHALQLLEVGTNILALRPSLQWISKTFATIPSRHCAADSKGATLIICVQAPAYSPLSWPSADVVHDRASAIWTAVQADVWPDIYQNGCVSVFSEYIEFYGKRHKEPRPLLPPHEATRLLFEPSPAYSPVAYSTLLSRFCTCLRMQERITNF